VGPNSILSHYNRLATVHIELEILEDLKYWGSSEQQAPGASEIRHGQSLAIPSNFSCLQALVSPRKETP
jgi:hypothetical protein